MLLEEGGTDLLKELMNYEKSHPDIRQISSQILTTLEVNVI